jgi:indolepyruvate ferredoxin oxidoreductase, beta subunit
LEVEAFHERRPFPFVTMKQSDTVDVVLAGVGGQGILLASEIVARAALAAGLEVKTNEVHGMAQRGGSVLAQIRYGLEVHSPLVELGAAQVLGALERIESLRYADYLAPGGLAVVSSQMVIPITVSSGQARYPEDAEARIRRAFPRLVYLDATALAARAGNVKCSNLVVVGALSTGLTLPLQAWQEAIRQSVKPQFLEVNLRAFEAGSQAA